MLIPLAPPTHAIGNAGWFVAAAVALLGCASTVYDRVKPGDLLARADEALMALKLGTRN